MPFTPHGNNKPSQNHFSAYTARNTIVPFTLHGLTKVTFHIYRMEITKRLYITAWITQIYIRLLTAWANKTVPSAMHGLVKFSINFLLHGLTHHLCVHRTDYRNCSVYTARNTIVPFTPHGLTKVNFNLNLMEITKLLHITFRFHRTDYRNCSVYTARNTIVPFTPHGLAKVIFFIYTAWR